MHAERLLNHIWIRLHLIQEFGEGLIHFQSPSRAKAHACQRGSTSLASEQAACSASPSSASVRKNRSIALSRIGKTTLGSMSHRGATNDLVPAWRRVKKRPNCSPSPTW